MVESDRIYVQVPAYRDPELLPTLVDMMRTASEPGRLVVAVVWQYGAGEERLAGKLERLGVRLLAIPAADSQGCNWARNLLQQGWADEEYTLWLDSHHRFAPGWDASLVAMLEGLRRAGSPKPVLTAYLPPYDPRRDPVGRLRAMYALEVEERREGLAYRLRGHPVEAWEALGGPQPERFASLHCLFADGTFNRTVPSDPAIYFFADEVAIALRAFTHGYDLFRPHVVVGWHLYDRTTRGTHWADHAEWGVLERRSIDRLRALYRGELAGRYGLGEERTVAEYESYANLRLLQWPEPDNKEIHSWNCHLARAIASPPSSATPTTSTARSSTR
jgi:hypothetical protein